MNNNQHDSFKYRHLLLLVFWAFLITKTYAISATVHTDSTENTECTFECYLERAEKGDAYAQYKVGMAYYDGTDDVENTDLRQGKYWLLKAAEQGYAKAQYQLGYIYDYVDGKIASDWYKKAAENGNTQAMIALAELYDDDIDRNKNLEQSIYWYTQAAEHHDAQAMLELARINYYEKDSKTLAMEWYLKSLSQARLEKWKYDGTLFRSDCSDKEAWHWYIKAAEQESYYVPVIIGDMYNCARKGVKQDTTAALQWYLKAAQAGNPVAQNKVGNFYRDGRGTTQNKEKAMQWYLQAAQQEDSDAQTNIALLYLNGEGVEKNYQLAMKWLLSAAESGNTNAMLQIARMYGQGLGVHEDQKKAVSWLLIAAQKNCSQAQYNLAIAYANGIGIEQDDKEAIKWFRLALWNWNKNAQQDVLSVLKQRKMSRASFFIAWGPLLILITIWIVLISLIAHRKKKAASLLQQAQRQAKR